MRQVKVPIAMELVPNPYQSIEFNVFEIPSTLDEAIKEGRKSLKECRCDRLPCTRCATIEIFLHAIVGDSTGC